DGEGGTNETPGENEERRKDDDDGGHYGIRETTPLIDQLLASRLDPSSAPFSATGSLLALGLIGWSVLGKRRRR
ncbi:MAG: hypothetical protein IT307_06295, partial [Chloroflexi bacterium]|nr:hypothetical protein [Chloroflexota bacterium]